MCAGFGRGTGPAVWLTGLGKLCLPSISRPRTIHHMDKQRFNQRQQDFLRAANRLREIASLQGDDILRDATIQRFEFTFEVAWKTLQMYLQYQGYETTGPRQALKQAFTHGLIQTPEEADIWLAMLEEPLTPTAKRLRKRSQPTSEPATQRVCMTWQRAWLV